MVNSVFILFFFKEIPKNGNKVKNKNHYSDESGEQKKESSTEMQSGSPAQVTAVWTMEDSSGASPPKAAFAEELAFRNQPAGSYQQISCLDSVIRCGHLWPPPRWSPALRAPFPEDFVTLLTGIWRAAVRPPP